MSSLAASSRLGVTVLGSFDDARLDRAEWDALVARSCDVVFMTFDWQREWWRAFGSEREQLLLVCAERGGRLGAIAPLFAAKGMLFLVGSDGSDYLDVIGDLDAELLTTMLDAARRRLDEFTGLALHQMREESRTAALLPEVADRLDLELVRDVEMGAPYADLGEEECVRHLVARRGIRKSEARMRRAGELRVRTACARDIDEWLELFLAQHASRWGGERDEGLQRDEARAFCEAIVHTGHEHGWLRFTMLEWRGEPAAFEVTLVHGDTHLSYLGSRDMSIAHSPGAVLQADLVGAALEAGARRYDFGLGEEPYKLRDASGVTRVASWFLYPR